MSKLLSKIKSFFTQTTNSKVENQLNDIAFYVNMIKNGMTVKIDEYTALTRIFTGQKIYVDTRDVSNAPHLMLEGYWEMEITNIIRRYVKEDTVFFDIGAHVGYFALVAGTQIRSGKIHAFEANPELTPLIQKSMSVNGLDAIMKVNNVAIADKKGVLKLSRYADLWGSSTLHDVKDTRIDKTYAVSTITLDDYCKENDISHVDVIKMDIEGYEDKAYEGMQELIKNSPSLIMFMEYSDGNYTNSSDFYAKLQKDFAYIYYIAKDGNLQRLSNYEELKTKAGGDWAMIVLSHNGLR